MENRIMRMLAQQYITARLYLDALIDFDMENTARLGGLMYVLS